MSVHEGYTYMFRNLLFQLGLVPVCLFFSLLAIVFGRRSTGRAGHLIQLWWARAVVFLAGARIEADLEALDPDAVYVFMCNHQSNLDIPLLSAALKDYNLLFVAKESLFQIPFFGAAMRARGHVSIDRQNHRKAMRAIQTAAERIETGASITIFPEGTRSTDPSSLGGFQIGGMILALKCPCQVAPLVMTGSYDILPKKAARVRPGTVRIKALPPFDPKERFALKQREQFREHMQTIMNTEYLEMLNDAK